MDAIAGRRNLMSLLRQPLWTWLIITGSVAASVILTLVLNAYRLDRDAALAVSLLIVSPVVAWRVICRQDITLRTHLPELFEGSRRQADRARSILISGRFADSSEETTATNGRTARFKARRSRREREMQEAKLLLQAIDSSSSAVIQLRSLLIVQIPSRGAVEKQIVALSLSKSQREFLREHPYILRRPPEWVLEELRRARGNSESD
jgi:hypothetical protein